MRKIWYGLAALLAGIAIVFAGPSPAQAWSYCDNAPTNALRVGLWSGQGYCYVYREFWPSTTGACMNLDGFRDQAAAIKNNAAYRVRVHDGLYCTGVFSEFAGSGGSHPNLYTQTIGYHNAESIRLCVPAKPC
jgi:hypothetical protein